MRKYICLIVILMLLVSFSVVGCGNKDKDELNSISFTNIETIQLSDELNEKMQEIKMTENYKAYNIENSTYLVASWGQKNTGGYEIEFIDIEESSEDIKAKLKFTEPGEEDVVTQAITYPLAVVKIPKIEKEKVTFVNEKEDILAEALVEEINFDSNEISVSLYYGTENGELRQEQRDLEDNFRDFSIQKQAGLLIQELKKGTQEEENVDKFSSESELLEKLNSKEIVYKENEKILSIELSDEIMEIPSEERDMITESLLLTLTSIFEPVKIELNITDSTGEVVENYNKSFK